MRRYFSLFALLMLPLIWNSCVRNIEIDIEGRIKPVVYGMLEAGEQPRIFLYKSFPYEFDLTVNPIEFVEDAEISLIVDGEKIVLTPQRGFDKTIFRGLYSPDEVKPDSVEVLFYTSNITIQEGKTYELEVLYNNETLKAKTTVPYSINFISELIVRDTLIDNEGDTTIGDFLELKFIDDPSAINYYKYSVAYENVAVVDTGTGMTTIRTNYFFLRNQFISDENNNGETFTIRFFMSNKVNTFQNPEASFDLKSRLICYEPSLIEFNRSLRRQGTNDNVTLNPFTEPVIIKSNLSSGQGIFSALSKSKESLVVYKPGF